MSICLFSVRWWFQMAFLKIASHVLTFQSVTRRHVELNVCSKRLSRRMLVLQKSNVILEKGPPDKIAYNTTRGYSSAIHVGTGVQGKSDCHLKKMLLDRTYTVIISQDYFN